MTRRGMWLIVFGMGLALATTTRGVTWGPDLLNGAGDFDTQAHRDAWNLSVTSSKMTSAFQTDIASSPSYAWDGYRNATDTAIRYARCEWIGSVPVVGGRDVQFTWRATKRGGTGKYYVVWNGSSQEITAQVSSFSYWIAGSLTLPVTGSGSSTATFFLQSGQYATTLGALYMDDVVLRRAVADPAVTSLSATAVVTGTTATVSLYNTGGTNANGDLIAFDPDVQITQTGGVAVDINSVTWVNDNQADVQITTHGTGVATLQVQNPYGGMSHTFDLAVVSATPVLSVTPASQSFEAIAGWTTFTVTNTNPLVTGMTWTAQVVDGGDWLTILSDDNVTQYGTDNGTFVVAFTQNDNKLAGRTGTVRITAVGAEGSPVDVTVTQRIQRTWGPDLLNGNGFFDTQAARDAWNAYSTGANTDSIFQTTEFYSSDTAWKTARTVSGTRYYGRLFYNVTLPVVGGRDLQFQWEAKKIVSQGSYVFRCTDDNAVTTDYPFIIPLWAGDDNVSHYGWNYRVQTITPAGTGNHNLTSFGFQFSPSNTVGSALAIDNVTVVRQVADPVIGSKSADSVEADTTTSLSLFNTGGTTEEGDLIAFDPDVTVTAVSGAAVEVNSVTWVSDNQVDVQITPHGAGTATLQVQNPYGGLAHTFDLTVRGVVSGTVTIQNFTGDYTGIPVTIAIQSSPVDSHPVTLDANGHYSFTTTRTGTFDITAKAPFTLTARATGVVLGTGPVDFALVSGDANGDDQIGFGDFSILQNSYGQSGKTPAEGDFNGDGQVTFEDFSILQNNYGQGGAAPAASSATAIATGGCGGLGVLLLSVLALAMLKVVDEE